MKTLHFEEEPTHIELWDAIVTQLLYNKNGDIPFLQSIDDIMKSNDTKTILDSCAGSGFPSIHLRSQGYDVDCMDASPEAITAFQKNARAANVSTKISRGNFANLDSVIGGKTYNAIICKASIWYANNGYHLTRDDTIEYNASKESSLKSIRQAITGFFNHLEDGGILYVDKYRDSEESHFDKVAELDICGKREELFFDISYKDGLRIGSTTRITDTGERKENTCYAHDLKSHELEDILGDVGFTYEKSEIQGEDFFDVWLCQKK